MTHKPSRHLPLLLLTFCLQTAHAGPSFFGIPFEDTKPGIVVIEPESAESSKQEATPQATPQAETQKIIPPPTGLSTKGPRVLILVDVSSSVVTKAAATDYSMEKIKGEILALIASLPDNASLGFIEFARNYKSLGEQLLPLTPENRQSISQWVEREWVDSGKMPPSRFVKTNPKAVIGVLEVAAQMNPDIVYLISDGSFQWNNGTKDEDVPWTKLSSAVKAIKNDTKPAVLNFIGFQMDSSDRGQMAGIVQRSGGTLTQIAKRQEH